MNKAINIISGAVLALYCILVMALIYDLTIATTVTLKGLPYKREICTGFALLIALLGFLRMKRRWQGALDMKRFSQFSFARNVAKPALNLSLLFTLAEAIFTLGLVIFLAKLAELSVDYVLPMIIVLCIIFIDALIFGAKIIRGGSSFRVGINDNAVAYFNREMHIFYFTGLLKIEIHQDMINFQYKENLNIFLPIEVLKKEDRVHFRDALIEQMEKLAQKKQGKDIYIDDAFRSLE